MRYSFADAGWVVGHDASDAPCALAERCGLEAYLVELAQRITPQFQAVWVDVRASESIFLDAFVELMRKHISPTTVVLYKVNTLTLPLKVEIRVLRVHQTQLA